MRNLKLYQFLYFIEIIIGSNGSIVYLLIPNLFNFELFVLKKCVEQESKNTSTMIAIHIFIN